MSSSSEDSSDGEAFHYGLGYANRPKKTKEQLKDESVYGVFQSRDDRPNKTDSYGALRYSPMVFSSSSNPKQEPEAVQSVDRKEPEQKTSKFQFMSFSSASSKSDATEENENESDDRSDKPTLGMKNMFSNPLLDRVSPAASTKSYGMSFYKSSTFENTSQKENTSQTTNKPTLGMKSTFSNPMINDFMPQQSTSQLGKSFNKASISDTPTITTNKQPNMRNFKRNGGSSTLEHESVYGIGAKLLGKMGYTKGLGLGKEGKGILNPIEHKMRPQGLGLGGIKEKTKQSIQEAKRRGEKVEDEDEDIVKKSGKKSKYQAPLSQAEKTKRKAKNLYKTVHDMENEGLHIPSGFKEIIDMTKAGYEKREKQKAFDSLGLADEDAENEDEFTLQQKHLIDQASNEVEKYSGEWKALQTRKTYANFEIQRLEKEKEVLVDEMQSLESFVQKCKELEALSQKAPNTDNEVNDNTTNDENLTQNTREVFRNAAALFSTLQYQYIKHIKTFKLDELAVSVLAPLLKDAMQKWSPFHDPLWFKDDLSKLKPLFSISSNDPQDFPPSDEEDSIMGFDEKNDLYQTNQTYDYYDDLLGKVHNNTLSLYEIFIGNTWLPKIRRTLKEEWDPEHASSAILLLEEWGPVLPPFIKHEIYDEVIVPRLLRAIKKWRPTSFYEYSKSLNKTKDEPLLHVWLFPWFQYLSQKNRIYIVREVKARYQHLIRDWRPSDVSPIEGLVEWKDIIKTQEFDDLIKESVVPRLTKILNSYLKINSSFPSHSSSRSSSYSKPAEVIEAVFKWCPSIVGLHTFGEILTTAFFPKWEAYLYDWLLDEPDMEDWKSQNKVNDKLAENEINGEHGSHDNNDDYELNYKVSSKVDIEIILSWYEAWYRLFPPHISEIPSVQKELHTCIDLIDDAVDILPRDRILMLPKPQLVEKFEAKSVESSTAKSNKSFGLRNTEKLAKLRLDKETKTNKTNTSGNTSKSSNDDIYLKHEGFPDDTTGTKKKVKINIGTSQAQRAAHDVNAPPSALSSFREVVEEACSEHNLFFVSLHKAHPELGYPLYKISANYNEATGMTCYINDNVLWVQVNKKKSKQRAPSSNVSSKDIYEPISLDDINKFYKQYKRKQ